MQKMSKDTERKISEALDKVAALVEGGQTPTDAVVKVASNMHMAKGHVELLSRAFNTGRTLGHLDNSSSLLDKAADIPLVNPNDVMDRLFPASVKSAGDQLADTQVSADFAVGTDWLRRLETEKRAYASQLPRMVEEAPEDLPTDPYFAGRKAVSGLVEAKEAAESSRQALNAAGYKVAGALDQLRSYFREVDALPLDSVKRNSELILGPVAGNVLNKIASQLPNIPQNVKLANHVVDWTRAPYSLVRNVIDSFQEFGEQKAATERAVKQAEEATQEIRRPFAPSRPEAPITCIWESQEKKGMFGLNPMQIGIGATISNATKGIQSGLVPDKEEEVQKRLDKLEDPVHEGKLDQIRTQAMLHDLMANDPVISTHDPDTVISAYNQIRELAPEVTNKRIATQALLRRYLEQDNALGEFELDQTAGLENKLRQQQQPPQSLLLGANNG